MHPGKTVCGESCWVWLCAFITFIRPWYPQFGHYIPFPAGFLFSDSNLRSIYHFATVLLIACLMYLPAPERLPLSIWYKMPVSWHSSTAVVDWKYHASSLNTSVLSLSALLVLSLRTIPLPHAICFALFFLESPTHGCLLNVDDCVPHSST